MAYQSLPKGFSSGFGDDDDDAYCVVGGGFAPPIQADDEEFANIPQGVLDLPSHLWISHDEHFTHSPFSHRKTPDFVDLEAIPSSVNSHFRAFFDVNKHFFDSIQVPTDKLISLSEKDIFVLHAQSGFSDIPSSEPNIGWGEEKGKIHQFASIDVLAPAQSIFRLSTVLSTLDEPDTPAMNSAIFFESGDVFGNRISRIPKAASSPTSPSSFHITTAWGTFSSSPAQSSSFIEDGRTLGQRITKDSWDLWNETVFDSLLRWKHTLCSDGDDYDGSNETTPTPSSSTSPAPSPSVSEEKRFSIDIDRIHSTYSLVTVVSLDPKKISIEAIMDKLMG